MSQGTAIDKTTVQGVVSDGLPESRAEGTVQSLSLTNNGQLRVSSVSEDVLVQFFMAGHESQWGEGPLYTPDSPWENW